MIILLRSNINLLFVSDQTFTEINGSSAIKGNFVNTLGDTVTRFSAKVSQTCILSFIQTFLYQIPSFIYLRIGRSAPQRLLHCELKGDESGLVEKEVVLRSAERGKDQELVKLWIWVQ